MVLPNIDYQDDELRVHCIEVVPFDLKSKKICCNGSAKLGQSG